MGFLFSSAAASVIYAPVAYYIRRQRDALSGSGLALTDTEKLALNNHFSRHDLDRVKVVEGDPLPIPAPLFTKAATVCGMDIPGPSLIAGITFDHVIATREPMSTAMLFHELVHVVQFRVLGVRQFAKLYTSGLLRTGSYEAIGLERCAYELEARFEIGLESFPVEEEVLRWLEQGWF